MSRLNKLSRCSTSTVPLRTTSANQVVLDPSHPLKGGEGPNQAGAPPRIAITIPFRLLVSDNRKHITRSHGHGHVLTAEYRAAKDAIEQNARLAMRGHAMLTDPVRLEVTMWFPDARKRDIMNYSKLISDSLSRIAFADDSQIHVAQWTRAGIDREKPRAEITLTPLAP